MIGAYNKMFQLFSKIHFLSKAMAFNIKRTTIRIYLFYRDYIIITKQENNKVDVKNSLTSQLIPKSSSSL